MSRTPRCSAQELYSDCAVVGVADAYRGQTVKAFVVARAGRSLDERELEAFLKDKLSPIELPKIYEFRPSLPKTAIGKIDKKLLVASEATERRPA